MCVCVCVLVSLSLYINVFIVYECSSIILLYCAIRWRHDSGLNDVSSFSYCCAIYSL